MKRWYFYPFSVVYDFATAVRNKFYDWNISKSVGFRIPVIGVGNLAAGGSGKSPMVMYLADLLSKNYKTGVLSRGYGRATTGYRIANYESNSQTVGDEAMQLFDRYKNRIVIGVCEDRAYGAEKIIREMDLQVLVLDDSFQHRRVKPGMNLLLTDYSDPYFKDFVLPAGDLRESRANAKRAQIIVVTKCPENLSEEKKHLYISKIKPQPYQKVFFSSIRYDENIYSGKSSLPDNNLGYYEILLITGIANPKPLLKYLAKFTQKVKHLKYRDHHNFTPEDIAEIQKEYKKMGDYKIILTTEKDYARLKIHTFFEDKLYYLPINIEIDKKEEFNQIIINYVGKV